MLFFLVLATVTLSAAGPEPAYKAPRTENGQPDLQGVWNFNSSVPLQRLPAVADKKVLTREEFDKQVTGRRNSLLAIVRLTPVENVGLDWIDDRQLVDDLRTSIMTYPENGRLPKLVDGVQRIPGVDDIIALVGDAKGGLPPALVSLIAAFTGGSRNGPEDFNPAERCLFGASVPLVPAFDENYLQILQSKDHVVLRTDGHVRIVPLDGRPRVSEKLRS